MIIIGLVLFVTPVQLLEIPGWGFASVGIGFFANAWVFYALKGRV